MTDNPRQIRLSHTPRYIVEQCAADSERFASTASHVSYTMRITRDGVGPGVHTGGSNSQSVCYLQVASSCKITRITTDARARNELTKTVCGVGAWSGVGRS